MFGSSQFGAASFRELDLVLGAIEKAEILPSDAKEALKEFVSETFHDLWESVSDIVYLPCPDYLSGCWESFIEVIKAVTS
jgi:hypothetical protein